MQQRTPSGLVTMSLVLTEDQREMLRELRDQASSNVRHVSISDIAREVVERGLTGFKLASLTDSSAITSPADGEAA